MADIEKIQMPVVVDAIDDQIASAYGALPDRLYLIGKGGHIVYDLAIPAAAMAPCKCLRHKIKQQQRQQQQ